MAAVTSATSFFSLAMSPAAGGVRIRLATTFTIVANGDFDGLITSRQILFKGHFLEVGLENLLT